MAYYRQVGDVPPKRHTQFRDELGALRYEELMGEEGFSSDSSLLYHRGVPSAIVDSQVWDLPDLTHHAEPPAPPAAPQAARPGSRARPGRGRRDAVTGRRLVLGNGDVRISYVVAAAASPLYRNAVGDECVYVEAGAGTVETVFGVVSYRAGDYVVIPRATTHRWVPARSQQALPDRGEQPHPPAEALPVEVRPAARARAVLRARPARARRTFSRRWRGRRGRWSSTAATARAAWSAAG